MYPCDLKHQATTGAPVCQCTAAAKHKAAMVTWYTVAHKHNEIISSSSSSNSNSNSSSSSSSSKQQQPQQATAAAAADCLTTAPLYRNVLHTSCLTYWHCTSHHLRVLSHLRDLMPVQFAAHPATDNRMQSGLAVCVARRASWKHWCETHKNEMYAGPHQACDVNTVLHSPLHCTVQWRTSTGRCLAYNRLSIKTQIYIYIYISLFV